MRDRLVLLLLLAGCDQAKPAIVDATLLSDTLDVAGPYAIETVVHAPAGTEVVEVHWRIDGGMDSFAVLERTGGDNRDGTWTGAIPGPGRRAHVTYFLIVHGQDGQFAADPATATVDHGPWFSFRVLECRGGAGCPVGATCEDGICTAKPTCARDDDCQPGFSCSGGRCTLRSRSCTRDADCLTTETCDRAHAACVPR